MSDLFLHPGLWPVLLVAPAVLLVLQRLDRAAHRRQLAWLGPRERELVDRPGKLARRLRRVVFAIGWLLAAVALLQPAWGEGDRRLEQRGVDVVVCLDVSRSMLARDHDPTRLAAAQTAIARLADRARGDRLALVAFAGEARLAVPLTRDTDTFAELAGRTGPLSVGLGGTDLGAALESALAALEGASGEHEAVLLVTDGENFEERGLRAAETCRARGIAVHCVGFGSERGSKIAIDGDGGTTYVRDREGNDVVTRLDVAGLRAVAGATGGTFVHAMQDPDPLVALYESEILPMARKAFEEEERRERRARYQWPLAAAFVLLLLDLAWSERRS